MDFTLYTLGDIEIFRAALTAAAMIFSSDGGFVGEGGLGLGLVSVFGLMMSLTVILIQGVLKHRLELTEYLVMIIVFVALFVPKFRIQVEDYYDTGQVTAVDNVPLGIVFPGAMMSAIVKAMNDKVGSVYSTVSGGYYTNVVAPLKILNGFQKAAATLDSIDPVMGANLRGYVVYCLAQRDTFDEGQWRRLAVGDKYIDFLTNQQVTPGFTLYYSPGDNIGQPYTCADMKDKLATMMDEFYNTQFGKVLNRTALAAVATSGSAAQVKGQPITTSDYESAFQNLLGGSSELAKNYALMMLFTPHVNGAIQCAPNVNDARDLRQCMAYSSVLPQFAQDSAAAGSFWQRLSVYGMNSLLFLWICLAPVVAMVTLIMGARGLKIAGGYLLFGAWSQSWFIGAAIINFYIQKQIQYEVDLNGGIQNVTFDMFGKLAESLQIKIGLAGDMLASVPLIMMAVMSGSAYAFTQMAQRWGAADRYDEKVTAPSVVEGKPLAAPTTMGEYGRNTGVYTRTGVADPTYALSSSYESAVQSLNSARTSAASEVSDTSSSVLQNMTSHAHEVGTGTNMLSSMRQSHSAVDRAAAGAVSEIMKQTGISERDSVGMTNELSARAAAAVSSPDVAMVPKVSAEIAAKVGATKGWSQDKVKTEAERIGQTLQHSRENVSTTDRSTAFDTSNSNRSVWATQESETLMRNHAQAVKHAQSVEQAYQIAAALKDSGGFNMNFTPSSFAHSADLRHVNAEYYERALIAEFGEEKYQQAYGYAYQAVTSKGRGAALENRPDMARYAALYETASALSPKHALLMTAEASGRKADVSNWLTPNAHESFYQSPIGAFDGDLDGAPALRGVGRAPSLQTTGTFGENPAPVMPSAPAAPGSPDPTRSRAIQNATPTLSGAQVMFGKDGDKTWSDIKNGARSMLPGGGNGEKK